MKPRIYINPINIRKPRVERISHHEIIECYKYYFQELPSSLLRKNIIGLKRVSERHVYYSRNPHKINHSKNELIFIDFLEGISYLSLIKKHKLSRRDLANIIFESRKLLIDGIKQDVENGLLTYNTKK